MTTKEAKTYAKKLDSQNAREEEGDIIHHAICDARASSKTSFVVFFLVASKHRDIYLSYLVKWNSIQLVDTGRNESPNCIIIIVGQITSAVP